MRKVMILAAMLAMMLVAAAPAFAQATAMDTGDDVFFNDSFNVVAFGNQVQFVAVSQIQTGDANAAATGGSFAAAAAVNVAHVSQSQVAVIF